MGDWFTSTLLAVEEIPAVPAAGEVADKASGGGWQGMMVLLLPAVLVMLLFQLMGNNPRKQADQQLQMLKGLKKNDPVVTIGGIRGNFVSLSEDGSEVTLQLNDNMRVRFEASAIRAVPQPAAAKS